MFKKAAVVAVALAGQAYVEAVAIQKRDGAHGHHAPAAAAPSSGYGAPAPASSYGAPSSGYGAPAPASSYGAPAPSSSYGAPADSYGAPSDGYGAPADGYAAPADGYGAPSYGGDDAPAYGADEPAGPGLLPIVAAIIAVIGLSLLFPTFVNLTSVRRKRSLAEESNPVSDLADRVNDIYGAVLESEECIEKIACELGAMANDLKANEYAGYIEPFVPKKYSNYYKTFKAGVGCDKIQCGKRV